MQRRWAHKLAQRIYLKWRPLPGRCRKCKLIIDRLGRCRGEGMIHHRNADWLDNRLANLELLCVTCHHSGHHLGTSKPPGFGARISQRLTGKSKTRWHRKRISFAAQRQFANPKLKARWYASRWGK